MGFWEGVASIALTASYFTPLAAITVPATAVAVGVGAVSLGIGHATDNEDLKKIGETTLSIAADAALADPTGRVQGSVEKTFSCCDRKK